MLASISEINEIIGCQKRFIQTDVGTVMMVIPKLALLTVLKRECIFYSSDKICPRLWSSFGKIGLFLKRVYVKCSHKLGFNLKLFPPSPSQVFFPAHNSAHDSYSILLAILI